MLLLNKVTYNYSGGFWSHTCRNAAFPVEFPFWQISVILYSGAVGNAGCHYGKGIIFIQNSPVATMRKG